MISRSATTQDICDNDTVVKTVNSLTGIALSQCIYSFPIGVNNQTTSQNELVTGWETEKYRKINNNLMQKEMLPERIKLRYNHKGH